MSIKSDTELFKKALSGINSIPYDDNTLFKYFNAKGDDFNGRPDELNQAVSRGLYIATHEPENFNTWNEGFTMGTGWSIQTLSAYLVETLEKEGAL